MLQKLVEILINTGLTIELTKSPNGKKVNAIVLEAGERFTRGIGAAPTAEGALAIATAKRLAALRQRVK